MAIDVHDQHGRHRHLRQRRRQRRPASQATRGRSEDRDAGQVRPIWISGFVISGSKNMARRPSSIQDIAISRRTTAELFEERHHFDNPAERPRPPQTRRDDQAPACSPSSAAASVALCANGFEPCEDGDGIQAGRHPRELADRTLAWSWRWRGSGFVGSGKRNCNPTSGITHCSAATGNRTSLKRTPFLHLCSPPNALIAPTRNRATRPLYR